jgi:hypothetical protein
MPVKVGHAFRKLRGLREWLRRDTTAEYQALIRNQLGSREQVWLQIVQKAIFEGPENPYNQMFDLAGCRYPDLEESVRREGLESTLRTLHRAGVYLTHYEFKGESPIVRGGRRIASGGNSFLNPLARWDLEAASGGSRSDGTISRYGSGYRKYVSAYRWLQVEEFRLRERVHALLFPALPSPQGMSFALDYARLGCRVERWFALASSLTDPLYYRTTTRLMLAAARLASFRLPNPTPIRPNHYRPVAEWIGRRKQRGDQVAVSCYVGPAVGVAAAGLQHGIDISGTLFLMAGEAQTEARLRCIADAGCEVASRYHITEIGPIGFGCRHMAGASCVHLFRDSVAAITHRRAAPHTSFEVDSFLFTTLNPSAPNVLINVEMDDAGTLGDTTCDCAFSAVGLSGAVRDVASFGKLTGRGVTLAGTDIVRVLETALPARFGGYPTDYQLVQQPPDVRPELRLRVHPRVSLPRPGHLQRFFQEQVLGGALLPEVQRMVETVEVERGEPLVTGGGKVLHLAIRPAA